MTLIKSISGIRGTIGGTTADNLTPLDVVKFASAYGMQLLQNSEKKRLKVVIGRDARISGEMVYQLVAASLNGLGIDVLNIGLATTPTTEMAVTDVGADGGIILTASHNPKQWNALKLLNGKGEFISDAEGKAMLEIADKDAYVYAEVDDLGKTTYDDSFTQMHIDEILKLPLVDVEAIKKANFKVAIDCVNSVGGTSIPPLLKQLGVEDVIELYCEPTGEFPHNPEPLPENLTELSEAVRSQKADLGFTVDPDVDRLAIINEDGTMFGEEYTLVAVADYILQHKKGNTVSNLSSSRALRDVTEQFGGSYQASAVGEVNVVAKMKETNAVIGGEGNGGIIYPELHYGRDSLVGIALFLTHLAKSGKKCTELRAGYPAYSISKNKLELSATTDVDGLLKKVEAKFGKQADVTVTTIDGVKLDFPTEWVHLRKSNTEPIVRVYAESKSPEAANKLALQIIDEVKTLL